MRKNSKRSITILLVALVLFTGINIRRQVQAQVQPPVNSTSGNATLLTSAPSSVDTDVLQSNSLVRVFTESVGFLLTEDIDVDLTGPGAYPPLVPVAGTQTISAGTLVNSIFLHFDPNITIFNNTGSVTFNSDILGVIVIDASLDSSDPVVGSPSTTYPTGTVYRGTELVPPFTDVLAISSDLRTISFNIGASSGTDQLRVITAVQDPSVSHGISSTSGNVSLVSPPSSVVLGAVENNMLTRVFMENDGLQLGEDLIVDISDPGSYPPQTLTPSILDAGTIVSSYFFHFDTVEGNLGFSSGSVTFDNDILGVLVLPTSLDASDNMLGASGALYPVSGSEPVRGADLELDSVEVSADRRTLIFNFGVDLASDQIRVLTTTDEIAIVTESPLSIELGEVFARQIDASGGTPPYFWSTTEGSLPNGVTFNSNGVLSGRSIQAGSFSITISATDTFGNSVEKIYEIEVPISPPPPQLQLHKVGVVPVPGRVMDYFILVQNVGDVPATGIEVVEFLEPWFTFVSANPPPKSDPEFNTILWDIGTLGPDEFTIISYKTLLDPALPLGTEVTGKVCGRFEFVFVGDENKPNICEAEAFTCIDNLKKGCEKVKDLEDILEQMESLSKFGKTLITRKGDSIPYEILAVIDHLLHPGFQRINDQGIKETIHPKCWTSGLEVCGYQFRQCENSLFTKKGEGILLRWQRVKCATDLQPAKAPADPNEKVTIAEKFIQPDQILVYPIHFENIGDIEALDVFVKDTLDPDLDASTLDILTPGGNFDSESRTIDWRLLGIKLQPGETDEVLFKIKPLPGLPSGTEIRNSASIQFEVFETITTNEVVNIVDSTPPSCVMDTLPEETLTLDFPISWTGTDAIGEIEEYALFVSINGGAFTPYLKSSGETSETFTGEVGKTYGFVCVATDSAGNTEVQDLFAETTTTVVNSPPTANANGPFSVDEGSFIPISATGTDPDGDQLTFAWDLDSNGSFETPGQNVTFSAANLDGPDSFTITVQVADTYGITTTAQAIVNLINVAPTVEPINVPTMQVQVNTPFVASVDFTDLGIPDTHTAVWDWGDGNQCDTTTDLNCALAQGSGSGSASGSHTYTANGVYIITVTVCDDDGGCGISTQAVTVNATFLLIDEDSINSGAEAIKEIADILDVDPSEMVNDNIAAPGVREPLGIPVDTIIGSGDPNGTSEYLMTGEVGDEGWFALKTIPDSWNAAGPTNNGLQNYILAGPGLGTGSDPETLLDKIPDVTPLRTAGLEMLAGLRVCAIVYDSDISINYDPLEGNLQGANLGLVAFEVLTVGSPSSSVLPDVTIQIADVNETCGGPLELFLDAPVPISSSEPSP